MLSALAFAAWRTIRITAAGTNDLDIRFTFSLARLCRPRDRRGTRQKICLAVRIGSPALSSNSGAQHDEPVAAWRNSRRRAPTYGFLRPRKPRLCPTCPAGGERAL